MPFGIDSPKDYYGTKGKDPEAARQTFILPWNDIDAVKDCFEKYAEFICVSHHFGLNDICWIQCAVQEVIVKKNLFIFR